MITINSFLQPAAGAGNPFILSSGHDFPRNDFTGYVGFRFTVGSSNITITDLGRWVLSGNSGSHTVRITDVSGTLIVSAIVNTSGASVGFVYSSITPTVLSAGTDYFIQSLETSGADTWYDDAGPTGAYTTTSDATLTNSSYSDPPVTNTANRTYGPPNFKYHL